jgi:uncharacterized protein
MWVVVKASAPQREGGTVSTDVDVHNNTGRHRYEATVGETLAGFVEYQLATDLVVLTHTEVDESFEGQGIGSRLARAALDDVRGRGIKALVICPFINGWVRHHREYVDVLYGAPPSKVTD